MDIKVEHFYALTVLSHFEVQKPVSVWWPIFHQIRLPDGLHRALFSLHKEKRAVLWLKWHFISKSKWICGFFWILFKVRVKPFHLQMIMLIRCVTLSCLSLCFCCHFWELSSVCVSVSLCVTVCSISVRNSGSYPNLLAWTCYLWSKKLDNDMTFARYTLPVRHWSKLSVRKLKKL